MGMYDIQQDGQSQLVRAINQTLEFLGRSVSGTDGEERGHLVPKGRIVGVLHDGHHLDTVVSEFGDTGQDIVPEFDVGPDLGVRGGDADWRRVSDAFIKIQRSAHHAPRRSSSRRWNRFHRWAWVEDA